MKALAIFLFFTAISFSSVRAQTVLQANGPGNTYELINSVFAPGYDAVENAECAHPQFGRHIAEVLDTDLNQFVFEFYVHVTPDNDRCINFDRQRVEIKTYDASPENLKGRLGEIVNYKWRFKIPVGFQPSSSFTHIHQVKAVGGDDDQPMFTLTARKGSPNKLELIYVADGTSGTVKERIVNLSAFEGVWVEATEQVFISPAGFYNINIRRVSDGVSLLSYSNNNISTIRPDNDFIRPKWGIYRSLNTPADLRDESIRFSLFSISEGLVLSIQLINFSAVARSNDVLLNWATASETGSGYFIVERSADGINYTAIGNIVAAGNSQSTKSYQFVDQEPLSQTAYYRLRQTDIDGRITYSPVRQISASGAEFKIYPNPVHDVVRIDLPVDAGLCAATLLDVQGKVLSQFSGDASRINVLLNGEIPHIAPGHYLLRVRSGTGIYTGRFYKF